MTATSYNKARQSGNSPERYIPEGFALSDLNLASGLGVITAIFAVASLFISSLLKLHPISGFWGSGFVLSGLICFLAAVKRESYPSKEAMYRSSMASLIGAGAGFVLTLVVWALLVFVPLN